MPNIDKRKSQLARKHAQLIEETLKSLGIVAQVAEVNFLENGVQYCLEISVGTKIADILAYQKELALAVASPTATVQIEAPIRGRSLVGITIPYGTKQRQEKVSYKIIKVTEKEPPEDFLIQARIATGNLLYLLARAFWWLSKKASR